MNQTPSPWPRRSVVLVFAGLLLATALLLTLLATLALVMIGLGQGKSPDWIPALLAAGMWLLKTVDASGPTATLIVPPLAFVFNLLYLWLLGAAILLVLWLPFGLLRLGRHHLRRRPDDQ